MSPKTTDAPVYNSGYYVRSIGNKGGESAPFDVNTYMQTPANYLWVQTCIEILASMIASVPMKIYERKGKDVIEVENSPFIELFKSPNPEYTEYEFRYLMAAHLILLGNVFMYDYYKMVSDKVPAHLYLLSPRLIRIIPDDMKRVKAYVFGVNGNEIMFTPDEISHIRRPNVDSHLYGLSPIQSLEMSIATDLNAMKFNKTFFENSAIVGGLIEQKESTLGDTFELKQETVDQINAKFESAKGSSNAGKLIVLPPNCTYRPMYESLHADMQFIEQRNMTRQEVLSVFKVPPALAGLIEGNSAYANIKEQHQIIWEIGLKPYLRLIESVLNRDLIQPAFPNQFCKHDLSDVKALQEDENSRLDRALKGIAGGVMTINEARELVGLDARKEPEADAIYIPFSLKEIGADQYADMSYEQTPPDQQQDQQKAIINNTQKAHRAQYWHKYYNKNKPYEDQVKKVARRLFEQDKQYFLSKIKGIDQQGMKSVLKCARSEYIHADIELKSQVDGYITKQFEPFEEGKAQRIAEWTNILVNSVLSKIFADNYDDIGGAVNDAAIARFIADRKNMIVGVVDETFKTIMAQIQDGLLEGLSIEDMSKNISSTMDNMKDYRAKRIARTETGTAANKGHFESANDNGFQFKTWVSIPDNKTRDSHGGPNGVDGEKIHINAKFSNGLMHPNDTGTDVPASEVINCRCTVMYD